MSDEGVVHPGVAGYLGSSEIIYGELKLVLFLIVHGFNHIVIFGIYSFKISLAVRVSIVYLLVKIMEISTMLDLQTSWLPQD